MCVCVCVCSLTYPTWNGCAPLCHLWPARFHNIFPHCNTRHDFREKVIDNKMCVLISSTTSAWNISHTKKKWARHDQKCIAYCSLCKVLVFLFILYWHWSFLERVSNNIHISNFTKIRLLQPSCSKQTDEGTWRSSWSLFEILPTRLKIQQTTHTTINRYINTQNATENTRQQYKNNI